MIVLAEPYAPRPIRPLGLWQLAGFRVKAHGIAYRRGQPRPELVEAGRVVAGQCLASIAAATRHYGVGHVGVHDGRGACFVFVDWWADENELHHHVFASPVDAPAALAEITASGPAACVWDLAVMAHERQAWLDTVLRAPVPDVEAYLGRWLSVDV